MSTWGWSHDGYNICDFNEELCEDNYDVYQIDRYNNPERFDNHEDNHEDNHDDTIVFEYNYHNHEDNHDDQQIIIYTDQENIPYLVNVYISARQEMFSYLSYVIYEEIWLPGREWLPDERIINLLLKSL